MLPLTVGWLVGLPAGVWALRVLRRPEVRAAFAEVARRLAAPVPWDRLAASVTTWSLLFCGLGAAACFLPWVKVSVWRDRDGVLPRQAPPIDTYSVVGVECLTGLAALFMFGALALLVAVGPRVRPFPAWPDVRLWAGAGGLVLVAAMGLRLGWGGDKAPATWIAPEDFQARQDRLAWDEGKAPATDTVLTWALLALGAPLLAAPLTRSLPWRPMAVALGGWVVAVLVGLFIVGVYVQDQFGLFVAREFPGFVILNPRDLAKPQTIADFGSQPGLGPVLAWAFALGLVLLGGLEALGRWPADRRGLP
jgi:hypothetical protein